MELSNEFFSNKLDSSIVRGKVNAEVSKPNLAPKDAPAIAISGLLLLVTKILADTESGMCELFELDKTPSSENRLDRSNFGEILG